MNGANEANEAPDIKEQLKPVVAELVADMLKGLPDAIDKAVEKRMDAIGKIIEDRLSRMQLPVSQAQVPIQPQAQPAQQGQGLLDLFGAYMSQQVAKGIAGGGSGDNFDAWLNKWQNYQDIANRQMIANMAMATTILKTAITAGVEPQQAVKGMEQGIAQIAEQISLTPPKK